MKSLLGQWPNPSVEVTVAGVARFAAFVQVVLPLPATHLNS